MCHPQNDTEEGNAILVSEMFQEIENLTGAILHAKRKERFILCAIGLVLFKI